MTKIYPVFGEGDDSGGGHVPQDWNETAENLQKQERFSAIPLAKILEAVKIAEGHGGAAAQVLSHGDFTAAPEAPPSEPEALPSEPEAAQVNTIAEGHEGAAPNVLAHGESRAAAEPPPSEPPSRQAPCAEPLERHGSTHSTESKRVQEQQQQQAFELIEQQAAKFDEHLQPRECYYQCNVCCGWGCWSRMDLLVDGLRLTQGQEKQVWETFDRKWEKEKKLKWFPLIRRYFSHCESEKVFIACAVHGAAKAGNMPALRWLRDARLWRPRDLEQAQWAVGGAGAGGHLLILLGHFDLTVPRTLAEIHKERLSKLFKEADEQFDERLETATQQKVRKRKWAPEFYATLLANFIRVNDSIANELMQSKVVSAKQMCVNYTKQEAHALPDSLDFPRSLSPLFIRQDEKLTNQLDKEEVVAEGTNYRGRPNESRRPQKKRPSLALGEGAATVRREKRNEDLPLSKWMEVTLPQEARFSALIPTEATHFAYVYPDGAKDWLRSSLSGKNNLGKTTSDESMEAEGENDAEEEEGKDFIGGFLYAAQRDRSYEPKIINCISFDKGDFAFVFGRGTLVEKEDGDKIGASEDNAWHRTTVNALTKQGVLQYRWVEPEESKKEMRGPFGGFAYKCKGEKYYYFKLASTGQVVTRGKVLWEMNAIEVKREDFDKSEAKDTMVIDVLKAIITPMSWIKRFRMAVGYHGIRRNTFDYAINFGKLVGFARINVPGAINPLLLYAIATTPRQSVANTIGAKAITCAAYNHVYLLYFMDFVLEMCCILSLWRISGQVRDRQESQVELLQSIFNYGVSLVFVSALWLKGFLTESLLLISFFRRGWTYTYFAWRWFSLLNLGLLLLVAVSVLHREAARDTSHHWHRVIVSIAMSCRVFMAMSFLGTMETWRFGQRILPVMKSIAHSLSFGITLAFALISAWSLFWGLSNREHFDTFASIFRLGLLGDFDVDEDLHGILEEEEGEDYDVPESYPLETIAFMGTSVFFTLSLMNIFIGIMTSTYDHFQDRVVELFVRNRAQVCTVYVLCMDALCGCRCRCRVKNDDLVLEELRRQVWCCYRVDSTDPRQQENDMEAEEAEASVRTLIKRASTRLKSDLGKETEEIKRRTGKLEKDILELKEGQKELKDGQKELLQELRALRSVTSARGEASFVS